MTKPASPTVAASQKPKRAKRPKHPNPTPRLAGSPQNLQRLKRVAVAYSHVEREWFPTDEAYEAEQEVEDRAQEVIAEIQKLGIEVKGYPGNEYFLTNLLVDKPDLVVNLVDTLRGKDSLQTSVPGALELANIPYTGAGMQGLVIGNDRNLIKQLLLANDIPTPPYQLIQRRRTAINPEIGLPLIVKLNESGGSVGIDNNAVKETLAEAQQQVDEMIETYRLPVVIERFIPGDEITVVVYDDGRKKHVFMGQKKFSLSPDGKYFFTSLESYRTDSYTYEPVKDPELVSKIEQYAVRAFNVLKNRDYSKFDIRVDSETRIPYFTDANPNTAFGPDPGLPFTEVLQTLYGVSFQRVLMSLLSKYGKKLKARS